MANTSPRKIFLYVVVPAIQYANDSYKSSMPGIIMDELRSLKPKKKEQKYIDIVEAMLRDTFDEWKSKQIESPTVKIGKLCFLVTLFSFKTDSFKGVMSMEWGWSGDSQEERHLKR